MEKYKGDINAQAWVDSRELTVVSNWMEHEGMRPKFLSEVMRECLSIVAGHLVKAGLAEAVELASDAHLIIGGRFGVRFDSKNRGNRNRLLNYSKDDRKGLDSMFSDKKVNDGWMDAVKKARERIDVVDD